MDSVPHNINLPLIPCEVRYSQSDEAQRVAEVFGKTDWYKANGYSPLLPQDLPAEQFGDRKAVDAAVKGEYDAARYQGEAAMLEQAWHKVAERARMTQEAIPGGRRLGSVRITITHYGVGGSYDTRTNEIIINTATKAPELYSFTLAHESVHLMIEGFIKKYAVSHWRKERLVDLIVAENFSELKHIQRGKLTEEEETQIHTLFREHYPDIEAICKKLAAVKGPATADVFGT
ncbi:MAG: hypothetical protein A2542_00895 [Parcubacteria group bacterium RIFOXYD2_FULL_52_8]|nr:MAG: hypothetical protein A2542_00895 [Parcubacteria group bacterium RIFOXYD2_FULL_52_8]